MSLSYELLREKYPTERKDRVNERRYKGMLVKERRVYLMSVKTILYCLLKDLLVVRYVLIRYFWCPEHPIYSNPPCCEFLHHYIFFILSLDYF